jgi:hypothetical protein
MTVPRPDTTAALWRHLHRLDECHADLYDAEDWRWSAERLEVVVTEIVKVETELVRRHAMCERLGCRQVPRRGPFCGECERRGWW